VAALRPLRRPSSYPSRETGSFDLDGLRCPSAGAGRRTGRDREGGVGRHDCRGEARQAPVLGRCRPLGIPPVSSCSGARSARRGHRPAHLSPFSARTPAKGPGVQLGGTLRNSSNSPAERASVFEFSADALELFAAQIRKAPRRRAQKHSTVSSHLLYSFCLLSRGARLILSISPRPCFPSSKCRLRLLVARRGSVKRFLRPNEPVDNADDGWGGQKKKTLCRPAPRPAPSNPAREKLIHHAFPRRTITRKSPAGSRRDGRRSRPNEPHVQWSSGSCPCAPRSRPWVHALQAGPLVGRQAARHGAPRVAPGPR